VPLTWYPMLLDATPKQRMNWKIAGGGYGIHWPDLDEDSAQKDFCTALRLHAKHDNPTVHHHPSRHPDKSVLIACGVNIRANDDTRRIYAGCSGVDSTGKVERRVNATL
jgi:hypothetical protein